MFHYLAGQVVGLVIGFIAGAFTPSIGRIIKGWFVKETKYVEGQVKSGIGSVTKHL